MFHNDIQRMIYFLCKSNTKYNILLLDANLVNSSRNELSCHISGPETVPRFKDSEKILDFSDRRL